VNFSGKKLENQSIFAEVMTKKVKYISFVPEHGIVSNTVPITLNVRSIATVTAPLCALISEIHVCFLSANTKPNSAVVILSMFRANLQC